MIAERRKQKQVEARDLFYHVTILGLTLMGNQEVQWHICSNFFGGPTKNGNSPKRVPFFQGH